MAGSLLKLFVIVAAVAACVRAAKLQIQSDGFHYNGQKVFLSGKKASISDVTQI